MQSSTCTALTVSVLVSLQKIVLLAYLLHDNYVCRWIRKIVIAYYIHALLRANRIHHFHRWLSKMQKNEEQITIYTFYSCLELIVTLRISCSIRGPAAVL